MTDRIKWEVTSHHSDIHLCGMATGPDNALATAGADLCMVDPGMYGVPDDVPRGLIFRFSRCKSTPRGKGGGSLALGAALKITDELGAWTVLEASPYPDQNTQELYAFYEKHGFKHNPNERGIMFRPPGDS